MTSVEAIREQLLGQMTSLLERPRMMASNGREAELLYWWISGLLETLEGRDGQAEHEEHRRYGKLGLIGPFRALFGERTTYQAEVVAAAAQLFAMSGHHTPATVVPAADWQGFVGGLRNRFDERDARRSVVREAFGEPSYSVEIGESWRAAVDGYMREGDPSAWVFFDFWLEDPPPPYGEERVERQFDPWLRDVRHPAASWADGLILTRFGKHLRWGHAWWMDHATREEDPQQLAITAQLREIREEDPSQSLRRTRAQP